MVPPHYISLDNKNVMVAKETVCVAVRYVQLITHRTLILSPKQLLLDLFRAH